MQQKTAHNNVNSWIYTIYSVVWPCMCHHRWDAVGVGAWLATADETLTFEPLVCDICKEWQMNRKRKEIFFFKRSNSPFLSGCGSWFGRLEPRPGRFPLSGDERRWSRWRKWHRISESCCRASFAVLLAHRKKETENFWTVFSKNLQLDTAKVRCGTV